MENNGVPLEEDVVAAAVTCSHDGKGIDAVATAPAVVTVSAGGKELDETAELDFDVNVSDYSPLSLNMPIILVDYYLTLLQLVVIN